MEITKEFSETQKSDSASVKEKKKEIKRKHGFFRYDDDDHVGVKSELENKERRKVDVPDMLLGRGGHPPCHRKCHFEAPNVEPPSEISSAHRPLAGWQRCEAFGLGIRNQGQTIGSAERQR